MATFLDALQHSTSKNARTENGAVTHSTSGNEVLNFFALAGAMRNNVQQAKTLFRKAYAEDKQLAIRALFYLRDIRGGQGERDLFRILFHELLRMDLAVAEKVLKFIPEYGRWDDLWNLGVSIDHSVVTPLIREQFTKDIASAKSGKSVSLMAKWLPSENASSKTSRAYARQLAAALGLSNREYRKAVVKLRQYIGLLEQAMSEGDWSEIDYSKLPSQASRKHVKAFNRHDQNRFQEFIGAVVKGEKKMNAGTTYTYEVVDMIRKGQDNEANAVWASLPDYTKGNNALVVADTSGSMGAISGYGYGRTAIGVQPIDVSVSLALYFAEHNTGPFHNYFLTFSSDPALVKVVGNTLTEKLKNISTANWSMSTDIEKVFDLVLRAAQSADANAEDIPKVIYIISDMEFNYVRGGSNETNYEAAKRKFEAAGYELPHIVFWNVAARNTNVPATAANHNVTLISGLSQSTFQYVVQGKTPLESMLSVLNGERYSQIEI